MICSRGARGLTIEMNVHSVADEFVKPVIYFLCFSVHGWYLAGVDKLHTCYVALHLSSLSVFHSQLPGRQVGSVDCSYSIYSLNQREKNSTSRWHFHHYLVHSIKHNMPWLIPFGSCCIAHKNQGCGLVVYGNNFSWTYWFTSTDARQSFQNQEHKSIWKLWLNWAKHSTVQYKHCSVINGSTKMKTLAQVTSLHATNKTSQLIAEMLDFLPLCQNREHDASSAETWSEKRKRLYMHTSRPSQGFKYLLIFYTFQ